MLYNRISWRRHGNAKPVTYKISEGGCWECTSHKISGNGYPHLGGKPLHRIIYEIEKEPIIDGNVVMHLCDNRKCINPAHLQQGTQRDNLHDMYNKNRNFNVYGKDHPHAKLNEEVVREIKILLQNKKLTQHEIAKIFKVSQTTIAQIKLGKTWKHVTI